MSYKTENPIIEYFPCAPARVSYLWNESLESFLRTRQSMELEEILCKVLMLRSQKKKRGGGADGGSALQQGQWNSGSWTNTPAIRKGGGGLRD